jgi:hypothetical protein
MKDQFDKLRFRKRAGGRPSARRRIKLPLSFEYEDRQIETIPVACSNDPELGVFAIGATQRGASEMCSDPRCPTRTAKTRHQLKRRNLISGIESHMLIHAGDENRRRMMGE